MWRETRDLILNVLHFPLASYITSLYIEGILFFSNNAEELHCHFIKIGRTRVQRFGERNPAKVQKHN